jgi:hypothetical protein
LTDSRSPGLLGCLPGSIPVGLSDLTYYVAGSLPKPPPQVPVPIYASWDMLGNDTHGDCGVAGLEHGFEADATIAAVAEKFPTAQQAIAYYEKYTGGQDRGVVLSAYLAYVRQHGYYGHKIDSYAPVAVHDIPTLQSAIFSYGFAYTGIAVTASMQRAFAEHQPWTTDVLSSPVVGGHCIPLVGYDDQFLYAITWGGVQAITYPLWHYISSEAWAVVTGEFVARNGDGRGVSLDALRADLDRLAV